MNIQSHNKMWVWAVIVIVVAFIGYFYFYGNTAPATTGLVQSSGSDAGSGAVGSDVLVLLNQIQSLKIDTSIFSDPAYLTLRDYSVTIPPVNVGRSDPFAPLPGFSQSSAGVTH